jgi:hypothetical protein
MAKSGLLSTTTLSGVVGGVFLSTLTAGAADIPTKALADVYRTQGPAVDGFNSKIDGFGGSQSNREIYGTRASFAVPLARQYGAQFDGAAASFDGRFLGNVGGHLFWRNPAQGLLGIYSDYTHWDSRVGGVNVARVAAEGEYYLGRWTLSAIAGVETGNSVSGIVGTEIQTFDVKTRFFDVANVAYYLQDNLKVFVGHRYQGGKHSAALGGEWGFAAGPGRMGALFAEGRVGNESNHGVFGGLKLYFGQRHKTLIRRHREDDPDTVPSAIGTIVNSGTTSPIPAAPQGENGP